FAKTQGALLTLAVFGLVVPAVSHVASASTRLEISQEIAVVLLLVYLASLAETFRSPQEATVATIPGAMGRQKEEREGLPRRRDWLKPAGVLVVDTIVLALMSEVMTDALEPTAARLDLTPTFTGIILLSLVSNIPQFSNAIGFARQSKMDLAIGV